jgi:hypothetical protein
MKSMFCITVAVASTAAFAQSPPTWSAPTSKDHVQLVGPGQMPLPLPKSELQKLQASTAQADDGFSSLSNEPDRVRQFFNNLEIVKGHQASAREAESYAQMITSGKSVPTAPLVVSNLTDLKVGFTPAALRTGKLIGVAPQGTIVNGAWTGVERYFQIEGGGYSRISETDMAASGGMFYMNKTAVNATVADKPAISVVFTDDQGRRVEEVLWVNGPKLYTVTYAPNLQPGRYGMMKANTAVSAFALATELR